MIINRFFSNSASRVQHYWCWRFIKMYAVKISICLTIIEICSVTNQRFTSNKWGETKSFISPKQIIKNVIDQHRKSFNFFSVLFSTRTIVHKIVLTELITYRYYIPIISNFFVPTLLLAWEITKHLLMLINTEEYIGFRLKNIAIHWVMIVIL